MAHDGKGNVRYKVDGQYVYLPKRTKEELAKARKVYMRKWIKENQDKVEANTARYRKNLVRSYEEGLK